GERGRARSPRGEGEPRRYRPLGVLLVPPLRRGPPSWRRPLRLLPFPTELAATGRPQRALRVLCGSGPQAGQFHGGPPPPLRSRPALAAFRPGPARRLSFDEQVLGRAELEPDELGRHPRCGPRLSPVLALGAARPGGLPDPSFGRGLGGGS